MEFSMYLSSSDVRQLCIEEQYYTRGDNYAYQAMFDMCGVIQNEKQVMKIAQDIKDHSNTPATTEDIAKQVAWCIKVHLR